VTLGGEPIHQLRPHKRVGRGLARTFQGIELWEDLSVEENLAVAGRGDGTIDPLEMLHLGDVRATPVRQLSQGRRQLVSIARALAHDPEVLLLDEPAGGLDSTESLWLASRLASLRDAGRTIVLIDHDMGLVLSVCDLVYVLDLGRVIAHGPPSVISQDRRVAEAYLGTTALSSEATA
jgi:ABC-type branched-subunit amino acid transport system ATPase component